jgi:PAS domain S-box-containing protein
VQNELTLRQFVDGISAPLAVMTPEGVVEIVNRQILDYFGKTLEELKAWSSSDAVHSDDLPGVITGWKRSIESGQPYNSEHRQRGADGVYRWFHVQGLPVRDEDGRILRWCVLQTDIVERKRAEGLLAGENLVLEMIAKGSSLESILEAVCRLVEQTADGSCCSVLVFDPSESTIQQVVAPSLPSSYNDRFPGTPVDREGGPCTVAAHHKTQMIVSDVGSDTRWDTYGWRTAALTHGLKACWSTTILDPNGLVLGTFAIYWHEPRRPTDQDQKIIEQMTHLAAVAIERKRNEVALRESAHELRLVFETIPAMVYTMNAEGDIELVNERLLAFLGTTSLAFHEWGSFIHPVDRARVLAVWKSTTEARESYDVELRLRRSDGAYRWFNSRGTPMRDADGRVVRWYALLTDIDDRKAAEDALRSTQTRLSRASQVATVAELSASIAHEINQPLASVVTHAHACQTWLSHDPPNLERALATLERIIRDGHSAAEVVQRIRALFKEAAPVKALADLNQIVIEVLGLLSDELRGNTIVVEKELEPDLPMLEADRVQIQQTLINLIHNAIEAMAGVRGRAKTLVVRSRRQGEELLIQVRDDGVGANDPALIFEPFVTTKASGMGMGLSITRSIVEAHGGRVWATANEDAGMTFSVALPLAVAGTA